MFFTSIKKTTDELEALITIINMDYKPVDDDQLCELMSDTFDMDLEAVKASIKAYRACKGEDFTQQSNRVLYG